jgi:hypothetical protein
MASLFYRYGTQAEAIEAYAAYGFLLSPILFWGFLYYRA